jgi:hypothetical protein
MVLRLPSCSPRRPGFLASVVPEKRQLLKNLISASGYQAHTTSPSVSRALRRKRQNVHRIPPNVRDDGQRPSYRDGTGRACRGDLPDNESGIYFGRGLDRANQPDPSRQIGFLAQMKTASTNGVTRRSASAFDGKRRSSLGNQCKSIGQACRSLGEPAPATCRAINLPPLICRSLSEGGPYDQVEKC